MQAFILLGIVKSTMASGRRTGSVGQVALCRVLNFQHNSGSPMNRLSRLEIMVNLHIIFGHTESMKLFQRCQSDMRN